MDNSAEYIIYQGGCLVCLRRGLGDWASIPCPLGPELKLNLLGRFPDLKYRPWSYNSLIGKESGNDSQLKNCEFKRWVPTREPS